MCGEVVQVLLNVTLGLVPRVQRRVDPGSAQHHFVLQRVRDDSLRETGKRVWHGEAFAQPSKVSVDMKE